MVKYTGLGRRMISRLRRQESPDSKEQGGRCKPALVIASVCVPFPHMEHETGLESTKLESHRDEWV